jgi:hypothetical protein
VWFGLDNKLQGIDYSSLVPVVTDTGHARMQNSLSACLDLDNGRAHTECTKPENHHYSSLPCMTMAYIYHRIYAQRLTLSKKVRAKQTSRIRDL